MKADHGFPICNCTSRIAYSSQSIDIILLLEKTILLQPAISPVHRSAPHSASLKLARLAKISSSNCWRQVGLPARGKGELAQVAELAGQKRWQHLVGEGWKGTTSSHSNILSSQSNEHCRIPLESPDSLRCAGVLYKDMHCWTNEKG